MKCPHCGEHFNNYDCLDYCPWCFGLYVEKVEVTL